MKKFRKLSLITIVLFIFIYTSIPAHAESYINWRSTKTFHDKIFVIKFNQNVDNGSEKNIIVQDSKGNVVPTQYEHISSKVVYVGPKDNYTIGETYTLIIENVTSNGKKVNPVKMEFTIAE